MLQAPPLRVIQGIARIRNRLSAPLVLTAVLYLAPVKRGRAEERLDLKTLYYQETDNRIQVIAPSVQFEKDLSDTLTLRVDGVYNAISGATPTGAPPPLTTTTTEILVAPAATSSVRVDEDRDDEDQEFEDDEDEDEDRLEGLRGGNLARDRRRVQQLINRRRQGAGLPTYFARAGATPAPAPAPAPTPSTSSGGSTAATPVTRTTTTTAPGSEVPKEDIEDTRVGANVEFIKKLGRHTPSLMLSHSSESDYVSWGVAVRDAIDFNQKNTTLLIGGAANVDSVDGAFIDGSEDKQTYDVILGVTQLLDRKTFVTCNLGLGYATGYLNDPYKVVELNGALVPEQRPDTKDKQMLYLALTRYVDPLRGSVEGSYRYYQDSFGIAGNTVGLAWYQKLGRHFVLRPAVRYYMQSAADFYGVTFSGNPESYSADYRVSELDSINYGLKAIWSPNDRLSFDAAFERYDQEGQDGVTVQDAYTTANYFIVGMRLWL